MAAAFLVTEAFAPLAGARPTAMTTEPEPLRKEPLRSTEGTDDRLTQSRGGLSPPRTIAHAARAKWRQPTTKGNTMNTNSTPDFATLRRIAREMNYSALRYSAEDAALAAEAVEKLERAGQPIRGKTSGYYRDEASFYRTEMRRCEAKEVARLRLARERIANSIMEDREAGQQNPEMHLDIIAARARWALAQAEHPDTRDNRPSEGK